MNGLKPIVIGHRGAAGEAPENTLASFDLALKQGAEGIELDIHISKDGELIVCHDPTLNRTTNGTGFICEQTVEEIKRFDAGSWFSEEFKGERVPLLSEVFAMIPEGVLINVEIKYSYGGRVEEALIPFLCESGRMDDVVVSSFDHKCISRIMQAAPEVKVGLLYAANFMDHAAYAKTIGENVYSLHPYYQTFDKVDVDGAKAAGLAVFPYTVNPVEEYERMIAHGVTGIITDFPARLVALLASKQ